MSEPCPFCGARIKPIMIGGIKKCPLCGGMWYDDSRGIRETPAVAGGGGAGCPCSSR